MLAKRDISSARVLDQILKMMAGYLLHIMQQLSSLS